MKQSDRDRKMLARTQLLMVVVSLVPLGVLFYISAQYVFQPLLDQGQNMTVYGLVALLGFTAITVVLGYVLVRRDTVRTIGAIAEGEKRLDQLYEATGRLAELSEPAELHVALLEVATEAVGAERAGLWIRERDELKLVAAIGMSLERGEKIPLPIGQGLVGLAAEQGRTLRDAELSDTDRSWDDRVVAKTTSSLVVPLILRGELAAVLDLRNRLLEPKFTPVDEQLAEGLARQAILFLDNAQFRTNEAQFEGAVGGLVKTVTEKFLCWPGHVDNVAAIAGRLAAKLNLAPEKQEALRLACLVHDIGLLDAPKVDIGPPGGPVDHAVDGADRLEAMSLWADAAPIVRHHHEQMDGRGPLAKRGFAIPMTARILALAEYVDTVTNPASPWGSMSLVEVVAEISTDEDKRFDPTVVRAFVEEHTSSVSALSGDVEAVVEDEEVPEVDPEPKEGGDPWAVPGS